MWRSDKWIANKMAKLAFGVSVDELIQGRALTELWLKRSHDKVHRRNKIIKDLDNCIRVAKLHIEQKERTINAKNNEIKSRKYQSRVVIDGLKECLDEKSEKIAEYCKKFVEIADWSAKTIKENRRTIKCLRENIRARNIRIEKLMSEEHEKNMNGRILFLSNKLLKIVHENYALKSKIDHLKKTLADGMEKGKIK